MLIRHHNFVLAGWSLFAVSVGLFTVAAWHGEGMIAFFGAMAFMGAIISFLFPFYRPRRPRGCGARQARGVNP